MGLFLNPYHYTPDIYSGIPGILGAGMPYPGYHGFPFPTPAVHRAPSPNVVTEDDFQKMIQIHRKRRLANEVYRQLSCYLLSSFCSVSIWRSQMISKCDKSGRLVCHWSSYHIFTSALIYNWTDTRKNEFFWVMYTFYKVKPCAVA